MGAIPRTCVSSDFRGGQYDRTWWFRSEYRCCAASILKMGKGPFHSADVSNLRSLAQRSERLSGWASSQQADARSTEKYDIEAQLSGNSKGRKEDV